MNVSVLFAYYVDNRYICRMEHPFEKLEVWQKSRKLVKIIYQLVALFPLNERHGLSDQLRRAVISVSSNLAEGSGRISYKEKSHFCEIAYGSLMEVCCQLMLAVDLGFLTESDIENPMALIDELDRQLCAFRRHLVSKTNGSA